MEPVKCPIGYVLVDGKCVAHNQPNTPADNVHQNDQDLAKTGALLGLPILFAALLVELGVRSHAKGAVHMRGGSSKRFTHTLCQY
ncbi:MAG: hypothetical protein LBP35_01360 [Candidatus Ancillula trichonymphae]|jgi:hypothetical protein|nr:hypothetical protein [Candidatus Ancillula trichonymphae]